MCKMIKSLLLLSGVVLTMLCAGCALGSAIATVTEYDSEGKIIRKTESKQPVSQILTESTKNKTVILWESGWTAGISCAVASSEDPTPHIRIYAGKADKGMISALPQQENWDGIAKTVLMTKQDLNVSLTGISGTSSGSVASEVSAINPASAQSVIQTGK